MGNFRFTDKTKNAWSERANFEHVHGKYDLLQVEEEEKDEEDGEEENESTVNAGQDQVKEENGSVVDGVTNQKSKSAKSSGKSKRAAGVGPGVKREDSAGLVESQLPPAVQDIMGLIFDRKEMEATLTNFKFDVAKAPLGTSPLPL